MFVNHVSTKFKIIVRATSQFEWPLFHVDKSECALRSMDT